MCVLCLWWGLQDKVVQLKGALSDAIAAAEELDELVAKKEQEISTLQERARELEAEKGKQAKQEAELSSLYRNSSIEVEELQVSKHKQLGSTHNQFHTQISSSSSDLDLRRIRHPCHMKPPARTGIEGGGFHPLPSAVIHHPGGGVWYWYYGPRQTWTLYT